MKAYTAQAQVDTYSAAIELAQALKDIVNNPDKVKEASKALVEASNISAEKKAEVEAAAKTLADAEAALDKLEKDKEAHIYLMETKNVAIAKMIAANEADAKSLANWRTELDNEKKRFEAEAAAKTSLLNSGTSDLVMRESVLLVKEKALAAQLEEYRGLEKKLVTREAAVTDGEAKLALKKKKLAEAAQED